VAAFRGGTVGHLVDSIITQNFTEWELILVPQGNDPLLLAEAKRATQRDERIRSVHIQQFGRSRALNEAVAASHGEILAFIDDDCEASLDWLKTLADCFTRESAVGLVAGDLVPPPVRTLRISTCPAAHTIECIYNPADSGYVAPSGFYWVGGNVAVRKSVMQLVGPFDIYLGPGTEFPVTDDLDFGLRAEEVGVVMWTTPKCIVYHTYGRRYSLESVLKHHRGYEIGRGALVAKLELWGHRLSSTWGQRLSVTSTMGALVRDPARTLLKLYLAKYHRLGHDKYLAQYELGSHRLSRPKRQEVGLSH
jgi:glycosyltransferase involved in cell wall biosynthesis